MRNSLKHQMNKKIFFLEILFVLIFWGCNKNPCIEEPGGNLPYMVFSYNYTTDKIVTNATVNPSNPEELLLFVSYPNCTVYRYNLRTKELLELYKTNYYEGASWGPNDWIVFAANRNIWKMKSNKDSLVLINNSGTLSNPIWSPDGKHIHCGSRNEVRSIILDENGIVTDTLEGAAGSKITYFINNDLIVQGSPKVFLFYNIKTDKTEKKVILEGDNNLYSGYVLVDNIIYYCTSSGAVRFLDMNNKKDGLLFDNCNGIRYSFQCYDKNTETIYAQRMKIVDVNKKNEPVREIKLVSFDKFPDLSAFYCIKKINIEYQYFMYCFC
jgi:hypothetical protein